MGLDGAEADRNWWGSSDVVGVANAVSHRIVIRAPPRWPRPVTPRMSWAAHSTTPTSSWPTWPPPNPTAPTNRGQTRRPTPRAPSESQARALATVGQSSGHQRALPGPPAGRSTAASGQKSMSLDTRPSSVACCRARRCNECGLYKVAVNVLSRRTNHFFLRTSSIRAWSVPGRSRARS